MHVMKWNEIPADVVDTLEVQGLPTLSGLLAI
jgi:hypothetical protein